MQLPPCLNPVLSLLPLKTFFGRVEALQRTPAELPEGLWGLLRWLIPRNLLEFGSRPELWVPSLGICGILLIPVLVLQQLWLLGGLCHRAAVQL